MPYSSELLEWQKNLSMYFFNKFLAYFQSKISDHVKCQLYLSNNSIRTFTKICALKQNMPLAFVLRLNIRTINEIFDTYKYEYKICSEFGNRNYAFSLRYRVDIRVL